MNRARNSIAINALIALGLLAGTFDACAGTVVGTVLDLSGPLLERKLDGTVKALSVKSNIEQGDTLVSEKGTYARIKFVDTSEITLKPNTQFKIENFNYEEGKPENDSAFFSLLKGGLRSITGLLGRRNKDRFGLTTPTATIGIRGTTFIAEYVPPETTTVAQWLDASLAYNDSIGAPVRNTETVGVPVRILDKRQVAQLTDNGNNGQRAPGLYVHVIDGLIHVSNSGGSQQFSAGQFGFTSSFKQPPVILPNNPGMQFTPPPAFNSNSGSGSNSSSNNSKPGDVDCEVR